LASATGEESDVATYRDTNGKLYTSGDYDARDLQDIGPRGEDDVRPDPAKDPLANIRPQRTDAERLPAPPEGSVDEAKLNLRRYLAEHPELVPGDDSGWR
jgi:hypothetical protein